MKCNELVQVWKWSYTKYLVLFRYPPIYYSILSPFGFWMSNIFIPLSLKESERFSTVSNTGKYQRKSLKTGHLRTFQ